MYTSFPDRGPLGSTQTFIQCVASLRIALLTLFKGVICLETSPPEPPASYINQFIVNRKYQSLTLKDIA